MNRPANDRLLLIGCGILQKEIRHLIALHSWPVDTFFFPSMLHVDFDALALTLEKALAKYSARRVLVYYGACHPLIDTILANAQVSRTPGQNCIEMLLGEELFTHELSNGAYFLIEDWVEHWSSMIYKTFGSNDQKIVRTIFHEGHSSLLCLRTPCSDDFSCSAEAIGVETGLPVRWLDVPLDNLQKRLMSSIADCDNERQVPCHP